MKIIHTSDWHLGQNFYGYERDSEHRHFFRRLAEIMAEHRPDALVVSGDVFHNAAPPVSAHSTFVNGVIRLHDASPSTPIIITAGNHDSGNRLSADRELWRRLGVHVIGGCHREPDGTVDPSQFVITIPGKGSVVAVPYFHPANFPAFDNDLARDDRRGPFFETVMDLASGSGLPVVLMAHMAVQGCNLRGHEDVPVGGMFMDKVSVFGDEYDYLALGHIHMPQEITGRAVYSGSPIPVNFSEDYDHSVCLVEIASHGDMPTVTRIPIEPLRRVATIPPEGATLDEALHAFEQLPPNDDCYVRILVDQDKPLPPDAEERARAVAAGKRCRFCEVHRKPRAVVRAEASSDDIRIEDVDDFSRLSPLEIAKRSYQRIRGEEMDPTLVAMLKEIVDSVNSEQDEIQ